ncbi:Uncharacterized protein conserved in bacteria [Mycobacteroides abscessus subsp. abscessus]|uniref:helix-turn-helix domain-containing protein n=1 Tax=Mycobacteroides abscessus TaxID=36809 RepID=UPI00092983BA|nr:helix-turn-helix domain-containing protein [Mycobacteroides abscessus]SIJ20848.1 Uncharacterized protein conserved in bacteria [Mycobacteroides abscessus subsp. abscessus]SLH39492.1 Uncharacterized protein conserved in bacteria [Mycobacteroides abscessus subsp. abscessus]
MSGARSGHRPQTLARMARGETAVTGSKKKKKVPADRYRALSLQMRWELCHGEESPAVRVQHLAALLGWHRSPQRHDMTLVYPFDHWPTAVWAARVLSSPNAMAAVGEEGSGVLHVRNPQTLLGRYGYRDRRWVYRHGGAAALGMVRGAVHNAGALTSTGLRVVCPSHQLMLTLVAVMGRLGITARPTDSDARTVVVPVGSVGEALVVLELPEIARIFEQMREAGAAEAVRLIPLNAKRAAEAGREQAARLAMATDEDLVALGEDTAELVRLRIEHVELSHSQLGELVDPPLTKDAVNKRLARATEVVERRRLNRREI